ncbi:MAG: pilus assembly protein TadG-related protein [Anaerolineae bacterium]
MESNSGKRESGQVLVIVTLFLVGMLAMLALVIDGGNIYLQRRAMQNAADAGAIAGARVLALNGTPSEAQAAVQEYTVQRNQADSCTSVIQGSVVTAIAHKSVAMTFARIVGINQVSVSAQASATFRPVREAHGLAPIAVQNFDYQYEQTYTIWDDTKDRDPESGDISGAYRGWLNLECVYPMSCGDGGASQLKEWMRNGYPGVVQQNMWIRGSSGTKTSVLQQARVGQLLLIAVYDGIQELYPGKSYYRVKKFAAFKITAVHFTGNPKGLEGKFKGYVIPGAPSDGEDGGLRTIVVTR